MVNAQGTDVNTSAGAGADGGGHSGTERVKDYDERAKQARVDAIEAEKQRHEQQMREATIGAAEGETATSAGVRQVESFNSGYSARGKAAHDSRAGVEMSRDMVTEVPPANDPRTRQDVSRQRSHQARRVRAVQEAIEPELELDF